MFELEIEIWFHTDDTLSKKDAGISYKVSDCELRKSCFYVIDMIAPFFDEEDNDREYVRIYVGDNMFMANYTYDQLKKIIRDHRIKLFQS